MIKRYKPHAYQHNKSVQALKRAGLYGVIITGDGNQVMASFVGNLEKALACTHMAFNGNALLKQIAEMVSGPKIEVSKGEPIHHTHEDVEDYRNRPEYQIEAAQGTILGDVPVDDLPEIIEE